MLCGCGCCGFTAEPLVRQTTHGNLVNPKRISKQQRKNLKMQYLSPRRGRACAQAVTTPLHSAPNPSTPFHSLRFTLYGPSPRTSMPLKTTWVSQSVMTEIQAQKMMTITKTAALTLNARARYDMQDGLEGPEATTDLRMLPSSRLVADYGKTLPNHLPATPRTPKPPRLES